MATERQINARFTIMFIKSQDLSVLQHELVRRDNDLHMSAPPNALILPLIKATPHYQ